MDLQADETIAVIAHQALMLHRAMCADVKPEPKAVLQHIQRMQGTVLTWVQQTMPAESAQEPVQERKISPIAKALTEFREELSRCSHDIVAELDHITDGIHVNALGKDLGFSITPEEIYDNLHTAAFRQRLDDLIAAIKCGRAVKPVDTVNTNLGVKPLKDKRKSNRKAA